MRAWLGLVVPIAASAIGGSAHAWELGSRAGRVALGAERLFGVARTRLVEGPDVYPITNVSVFGSRGAASYGFPRIGVDVFGAPGASIGISGGLQTGSAGSPETSSSLEYVVAPRAGFAFEVTAWLDVWIRAGATFLRTRYESVERSSAAAGETRVISELSSLAVTMEPVLVLKLVPHAALTVAGALDAGVWGERRVRSGPTVRTITLTELGASFGLLVEL